MKICNKMTVVGVNTLLVVTLGVLMALLSEYHPRQQIETTQQIKISNATKHPIMFIKNDGQWDSRVTHMARKQGMTAWLQEEGITFQFEKRHVGNRPQGVTMQMIFEGVSDQVSVEGQEKQSCEHNFFIGNDWAQWRSGVSSYAQVIYDNLYDNIDLCVREQDGRIEYDLLLSEHANLNDIVILCEGLKELLIDEQGSLVMETEFGPIIQKPPTAWYESISRERIPATCNFRKIDDKRYGFEVEENLDLALIIDPGLEWSTFLGGIIFDRATCLGLTGSGNVITSGETYSIDFPTTPSAYDTSHNGGPSDIFVSCLSPDGDSLLWSTFIGGSGRDEPYDLAVDNSDRTTVVGVTMSSDFPTTPSAFDQSFNGPLDAVMVRLNADGTLLTYSTYLGGSNEDWICTIDLNSSGEAYVGGYTSSSDFPTTPGTYDSTHNGLRDAFVVHMNTDGSNLLYSTYLGGFAEEGWEYDTITFITREMALALDASGEVVIAGMTSSPDFPTTPSAYDTSNNGGYDIFVARLNNSATDLIYSTFLGGTLADYAYAKDLVLSASGVVTVAGATFSSDFQTTSGAYDTTYNGSYDAFVAQFDASGSNLLYSTYLGGNGIDAIGSMVTDSQGKIVVVGVCEPGFPTTPGAFDTTHNGLQDVFISRMSLDSNGPDDLIYSTYLGTTSYDWASSVAMSGDSNVVLAGQASQGFPTTYGAYDTLYNGGNHDAFVCRFSPYVGIEENKTTEPLALISLGPVSPNPSYNEFNYSINLTHTSEVNVYVVDVTGRTIEILMDRQLPAGAHEFSWQPKEKFSSGIYFIRARIGGHAETRKVLLVR